MPIPTKWVFTLLGVLSLILVGAYFGHACTRKQIKVEWNPRPVKLERVVKGETKIITVTREIRVQDPNSEETRRTLEEFGFEGEEDSESTAPVASANETDSSPSSQFSLFGEYPVPSAPTGGRIAVALDPLGELDLRFLPNPPAKDPWIALKFAPYVHFSYRLIGDPGTGEIGPQRGPYSFGLGVDLIEIRQLKIRLEGECSRNSFRDDCSLSVLGRLFFKAVS